MKKKKHKHWEWVRRVETMEEWDERKKKNFPPHTECRNTLILISLKWIFYNFKRYARKIKIGWKKVSISLTYSLGEEGKNKPTPKGVCRFMSFHSFLCKRHSCFCSYAKKENVRKLHFIFHHKAILIFIIHPHEEISR